MVLTKKYILSILIVAILGSLLYFLFNPSFSEFFPKCIFYSLTGLDCPGCGSQRAAHALLHGNVLIAADYNIMVVLCLPLILYSAVVNTANVFLNKNWHQKIFYSNTFVIALFILVVSFWILRNIPLYPFQWLSASQ